MAAEALSAHKELSHVYIIYSAGVCSYQPRSGFCSIRLRYFMRERRLLLCSSALISNVLCSAPLLKLRPRGDLINTLLVGLALAFSKASGALTDGLACVLSSTR